MRLRSRGSCKRSEGVFPKPVTPILTLTAAPEARRETSPNLWRQTDPAGHAGTTDTLRIAISVTEPASDLKRIASGLAAAFSAPPFSHPATVGLADEPAPPAGAGLGETDASATPGFDVATLHDLNGSRAQAALPKMLVEMAAGRTTARVDLQRSANSSGDDGLLVAQARFPLRLPAGAAVYHLTKALRALAASGAKADRGMVELHLPAVVTTAELDGLAASMREIGALANSVRMALQLQLGRASSAQEGGELGFRFAGLPKPIAAGPETKPEAMLVLLGDPGADLAGSVYLQAVHQLTTPRPAGTDFAQEKKLQDLLAKLAGAGAAAPVKDVGPGGLLVALAEALLASSAPVGAEVDLTSLGNLRADVLLFGENQERALIVTEPRLVGTVLAESHMNGVPAALIGRFVAEPKLDLKTRSLATTWPLETLRAARAG